jgi:hypothetical protein
MNNDPTKAQEETPTVSDETRGETARSDEPSAVSRLVSRVAAWRETRAATAEEQSEMQRLVRLRKQQELSRQQEAASQAAVSRRRAGRISAETSLGYEDAPIPRWMQVLGIWFDRTFGSLPLIAPLVVSGYYTMQAGIAAPLDMHWSIALSFTLGLEGSLWYLARIYEKTRIEGDSTVNLRLGMFGIVVLISSVIAGHEYWKATGATRLVILGLDVTSTLTSIVAVTLMALVGIFVNAKRAAFRHRVRLRQAGLIDARAPKFSAMSWLLCPWETARSLKHATRYRISSPVLAVEDRRLWIASGKPRVWPKVETLEAQLVETPPLAAPVPAASRLLAETPRVSVSPLRSPAITASETLPVSSGTDGVSEETIENIIRETAGNPVEAAGRLHRDATLSYKAIGERLGISKAHAGRLGSEFYKRHAGDGETGDGTAVAV